MPYMPTPSAAPQSGRIISWKRIARYLGRSERTARRWEREENLPVHRLNHGSSHSVFALTDELDAWLDQQSEHPAPPAVFQCDASILVMPIEDLSPGGDLPHICGGIAAELVSELARQSDCGICVIANSVSPLSSLSDGGVPLQKRHGVRFALGGSLRVQAGELKALMRLVDLHTGTVAGTMAARLALADSDDVEEMVAKQAVEAFLPLVRSTVR